MGARGERDRLRQTKGLRYKREVQECLDYCLSQARREMKSKEG